MYKQPILTKQRNCNNFVQILYSYLRHTDRLLDVFFLVYPLWCYQCFMKIQEEKSEIQKKVNIKTCVRDITFLGHTFLLMLFFIDFFVYSLPFVYFHFTQKKKLCSRKWWWGRSWRPLPPSVYDPEESKKGIDQP